MKITLDILEVGGLLVSSFSLNEKNRTSSGLLAPANVGIFCPHSKRRDAVSLCVVCVNVFFSLLDSKQGPLFIVGFSLVPYAQIYWLAPMAGGALAGVMRKYVFDPDRRKSKNVDCTGGSTQNGMFYGSTLKHS
jgi:hypothetical protein